MKCDKKDLLLYAGTDRAWLGGRTLAEQVEEALRGGATFVQLREKELAGEALLAEAREIQALCRRYRVPFVIDDDVALARQIDADGVHVGQSDMEAQKARALLGEPDYADSPALLAYIIDTGIDDTTLELIMTNGKVTDILESNPH